MDVHVAELNVGTMIAPPDDPRLAEFMDNLERINAQAEASPGFVWRLQTESGNATEIQVFDNPLELVNMSVWTSIDELKAYVYRTEHVEYFRRRTEWFEADAKRVALWWHRPGDEPNLTEAVRRLRFLERRGPSPYAFLFAKPPAPLLFEVTDVDDADTLELIERLNHELRAVAACPEENHFNLTTDEVTGENGRMIRARYDGRLVGCGAVRRIEPAVGEIKRMFVDESARGLKLGAALLDQLEMHAVALGIDTLKLETSAKQPAAVSLYEGVGFTPCDPWGEYLATPASSLCFSKSLQ